MPATDLALLVEAAQAASRIALSHFGRAPAAWDKPGGQGPVSDADLEVDRMLRAELSAARPNYGWLSEESADGPDRLAAQRVFIVDPIDGTRAFLAGEKAWAHSLAVADRGRIVAGAVMLPMLDRCYTATLGGGAARDGEPLAVSGRTALDGARVLATSSQMRPEHWPGGVPAVERHFRPSLAYRLCLAAEGRFDAALTFRDAWEWDLAAGDLILREAGATVTTRDGAPTAYNNSRPLVRGLIAAGPALHAQIMRRLSPAQAPGPPESGAVDFDDGVG